MRGLQRSRLNSDANGSPQIATTPGSTDSIGETRSLKVRNLKKLFERELARRLDRARSCQRFDTRINAIATGLGGEYQQMFLAAVTRHRERLLQEYQADYAAFRRRLGVAPPHLETLQPVASRSASLGEIAVRTAVRATVWESVWALFRAFR